MFRKAGLRHTRGENNHGHPNGSRGGSNDIKTVRPTWLAIAVAVAILTVVRAAAPAAAQQPDRRPNIVFLFADDWGRYAHCYAAHDARPTINSLLKTPHLDGLAREGVLFRNAFVPSPSCTPCRSSVLSGQYFFRTGRAAILLGAEWDPAIPSFPLLLRDAGHQIGKSYKVWSPGKPADAPYGGQSHAFEAAGTRRIARSTALPQRSSG